MFDQILLRMLALQSQLIHINVHLNYYSLTFTHQSYLIVTVTYSTTHMGAKSLLLCRSKALQALEGSISRVQRGNCPTLEAASSTPMLFGHIATRLDEV